MEDYLNQYSWEEITENRDFIACLFLILISTFALVFFPIQIFYLNDLAIIFSSFFSFFYAMKLKKSNSDKLKSIMLIGFVGGFLTASSISTIYLSLAMLSNLYVEYPLMTYGIMSIRVIPTVILIGVLFLPISFVVNMKSEND